MIEVNVGLATNDGGSITAAQAIAALQDRGFIVTHSRVVYAQHAKGGEDTLVAKLFDYGIKPHIRLFKVAEALRQDCIAFVADWAEQGQLVGPHAERWDGFDASYFHWFNEEVLA